MGLCVPVCMCVVICGDEGGMWINQLRVLYECVCVFGDHVSMS